MKRRELLAAATVAALWPARRVWAAGAAGYSADRYSRAIVIDALGGPGGYHPDLPDDAPLPDVDIADVKRSGLTAINVTVNEVGNAPVAPGESPDVANLVLEYNDPRRFLTLADDLAKRGWSGSRIDKILGGNFARLFAEVWGN